MLNHLPSVTCLSGIENASGGEPFCHAFQPWECYHAELAILGVPALWYPEGMPGSVSPGLLPEDTNSLEWSVVVILPSRAASFGPP
jgi:hypothetical protein